MEGYSELSVEPFITVRYIGEVEVSMQIYTKGCVGTYITVHYNG
jgi:hypothetical protein